MSRIASTAFPMLAHKMHAIDDTQRESGMRKLIGIGFVLAFVGSATAHELPPAGCQIKDWRFQIRSGIVTIEGVSEPGWAGDRIHLQAYHGETYLGNVDGFISRGGSFTAMATGFPSVQQMEIQYHCD